MFLGAKDSCLRYASVLAPGSPVKYQKGVVVASKKTKRAAEVPLSWAQLQQELGSFADALTTARARRDPAAEAAVNFDLAEAYRARWQRLKISAVVAARANAVSAYETAIALYQSLDDPGAETRARLALAIEA